MEELDAVSVGSAEKMDVRESPGDGGALAERNAEEAAAQEEADQCYAGTCACKITYVSTGKRVPPDKRALKIRERYD